MESHAIPSASTSSQTPERLSRKYPAIVHATVLTAFVAPICLLPYLVARKQISKLRRNVEQLHQHSKYLKSALDLTVDSHNTTKLELKRLQDLTNKAAESTAFLRKAVIEQDTERRESDNAISADLKKLLEETQHSRTQAATLRALGVSLADVAAFMQEVEIDFGMNSSLDRDRRGIHRLRLLALRMQSLKSQDEKAKNAPP